ACHAGGRGFESRPDRIDAEPFTKVRGFFISQCESLLSSTEKWRRTTVCEANRRARAHFFVGPPPGRFPSKRGNQSRPDRKH
ncbi:MAG: hypothetical protein WBN27_12465, partial [Eudoraea sp.]